MTSTIYLDTASKVARAALTGTALPAVSAKLRSHLKLIIKCFEGDDIGTVDEDTMRCVIKPKTAPSGSPALIDTSAAFSGSGETAQYVFEWDSADSVALRAHLDAAADPTQPQELRCEVEYELDGNPERVAFPIYFETSYTRPEDPAPEADADTSWEWLKAKITAGDNLTRTVNEDTKVITLSVPDFADGREIELQAGVTHLQWRYVGEVSWTDLVALSAITGPAGEDSTVPGPQGEDGSEIELQASVTHLQWRYVGEASWTDLIALSAITGPAGADGADALPVASQAEAEAGTANDKSMTPLRTAEAIAALAGGGGGGADVQIFAADGTWNNPSPATPRPVWVRMIGGGGGGGSGRKGDTSAAAGGGGGAGGAFVEFWTTTTALASTEAVVVGLGGSGGAGVSDAATNGNPGTAGGISTFAGFTARGGNFGAGGTFASGVAGAAFSGSCWMGLANPTASAAGGAGATGNGVVGPTSTLGLPTGGGGGSGGLGPGGAGGTQGTSTFGATTGGAGGTSGSDASRDGQPGTTRTLFGTGGGGGRGVSTWDTVTRCGNGGNGGLYGGGGGGGGGNFNDSSFPEQGAADSGSGGAGGNGIVIVITY